MDIYLPSQVCRHFPKYLLFALYQMDTEKKNPKNLEKIHLVRRGRNTLWLDARRRKTLTFGRVGGE